MHVTQSRHASPTNVPARADPLNASHATRHPANYCAPLMDSTSD